MKKSRKVIKIVINVLLWLFVAFAVVITAFVLAAQSDADGVPAIGGKCFLTVSSDSMSPTFKKGDLIIGKKILISEKGNLQVDDVITFYADLNGDGNAEINTHRVFSVNTNADGEVVSYVTKGDNWNVDRDPVLVKNVICTWTGTRVPVVGGIIAFLQEPTGFLCVIVLPLVLLFLYQLFVFVKTFLSVKNAGKRQITEEDEEMIKRRAIEEYLRSQEAKKDGEAAPEEEKTAEPAAEEAAPAEPEHASAEETTEQSE